MPVVEAVLIGRIAPLGPGGATSAIAKSPIADSVAIDHLGLAGDEQADSRHHGGIEKAVHHYARDHYSDWRAEITGCDALLGQAGAFGENLSTLGLTETDVCVGDLWQVGTALLQVSQARQPCWKLDQRFAHPGMARRVQATGRTGWYYRVIEPGLVAAGDELCLVERPCPDWSLARLLRTFFVDRFDRDALESISRLELLSESWRRLAANRVARGIVEDWTPRLGG